MNKYTTIEWVPVDNPPEYTSQAAGIRFVNLLLASEDGSVWPGDYSEGRFFCFGVEVKNITHWALYPNHPNKCKDGSGSTTLQITCRDFTGKDYEVYRCTCDNLEVNHRTLRDALNGIPYYRKQTLINGDVFEIVIARSLI